MLSRFVARAQRAAGVQGRVIVLVTSSREMRELNRRFRGQDHATDVLSFPTVSLPKPAREHGRAVRVGSPAQSAEAAAGDIAISAEMALRNAARLGHSVAAELKTLALHGLLHLAGYDHEQDRGGMAEREARLRGELRLPETLIQRAGGLSESHSERSDGSAGRKRKRSRSVAGAKAARAQQGPSSAPAASSQTAAKRTSKPVAPAGRFR